MTSSTPTKTPIKKDEWFDSSKVIVHVHDDKLVAFATTPQEVLDKRFRGIGVANFSDDKSESQRRKEGGIKNG